MASAADWVPSYPERDSRDIAVRGEYVACGARSGGLTAGLFPHQECFSRLVAGMGSMLLVADPGTGKTLSFLAAARRVLGAHAAGAVSRVYVIERALTVLGDAKNTAVQIADDPAHVRDMYRFMTYTALAKETGDLSDAEVRARFADSLVVFDEAHSLTGNEASADAATWHVAAERVAAAPGVRVILSTATPMVNTVSEIRLLLNLILPRARRISPKARITPKLIESAAHGYVSYVRSDVEATTVVYAGDDLFPGAPETARVVRHRMSPHQEAAYARAARDEGTRDFYYAATQALLFAFPDGLYGGQADTPPFSRYVETAGRNGWYRFKSLARDPKFQEWKCRNGYKTFPEWLAGGGSPCQNLRMLSVKHASIVRTELDALETDPEGTSFVYSSAKYGGGAVLLGLCFELFGFERFDPAASNGKMLPEKRLRYAIASTQPVNTTQGLQETLRVFNSPENVNGEYIRVLIGSKVSREGLSVFHAKRMHLLGPEWTESGARQAIARVLRAVSHDHLRAQRRARLVADASRAALYADPERLERDSRVTVTVRLHAAVLADGRDTEDVYMYRRAAEKEAEIAPAMCALQRAAVDYDINWSRNVGGPLMRGVKVCEAFGGMPEPSALAISERPGDMFLFDPPASAACPPTPGTGAVVNMPEREFARADAPAGVGADKGWLVPARAGAHQAVSFASADAAAGAAGSGSAPSADARVYAETEYLIREKTFSFAAFEALVQRPGAVEADVLDTILRLIELGDLADEATAEYTSELENAARGRRRGRPPVVDRARVELSSAETLVARVAANIGSFFGVVRVFEEAYSDWDDSRTAEAAAGLRILERGVASVVFDTAERKSAGIAIESAPVAALRALEPGVFADSDSGAWVQYHRLLAQEESRILGGYSEKQLQPDAAAAWRTRVRSGGGRWRFVATAGELRSLIGYKAAGAATPTATPAPAETGPGGLRGVSEDGGLRVFDASHPKGQMCSSLKADDIRRLLGSIAPDDQALVDTGKKTQTKRSYCAALQNALAASGLLTYK